MPEAGGLAVILERLDAYVAATDRGEAWALLDVFEGASRHFLLTGRRLVVLAQSEELLQLDAVGARSVVWNPKEWLIAERIPPPIT